jgi:predicted adenine nucleotide alpha hydrolase (AANH) superfamily ATPase
MIERIKLISPCFGAKVLLHSCCAPCSGEVIEALHESEIDFTVFFYNPNIHPREEYEKRKGENARFADKIGVPFVDADYDPDTWFARVKGLELEPERGARCTKCFDMRFERSALYAHENGFPILTSSFGISRWKNRDQVNACGARAAARYEDVNYWDYDWRKGGGSERMIEITKREGFYRQKYCGCTYSFRDATQQRSEKKI